MKPACLLFSAPLALALALSAPDATAQTAPSDLPPLSSPPITVQPPPPPFPGSSTPPPSPPGKQVKPPAAPAVSPGYSGYPYPYPYYPQAYGGYSYGQYPRYSPTDTDSELPPPLPRRRYDTGLFVGGVLALVGGMTTVFTGAYFVASGTNRIEIYCDTPPSVPCAHKNDASRMTGGAITMALGTALAAAGLPMWFIGSRYVTLPPGERVKKPALLPEVRVGAGSASLTLRF